MDSTVIQEIAKQLGMAVDQAGQFVTEQLPNYAALKTVQIGIPMSIMWALFLVFAAVSLISISLCRKWAKRAKADKEKYDKERMESDKYLPCKRFDTNIDDYFAFYVFAISGVAAITFLLFSVLVTVFFAPGLYGWMNYPESMLIDMALSTMK